MISNTKQNKVKFKETDVFRSRSLNQVPLPIKRLKGRKNLEAKVAGKKYQTKQTKSEVEERLLAGVRKHTHTVGTQKDGGGGKDPPKVEEICKDLKIWSFLWGCLLKSLKGLLPIPSSVVLVCRRTERLLCLRLLHDMP